MDIHAAEDDLETKLNTDTTNIQVIAYPDDPDTFNVKGPHGAILVSYMGSTYEEPENDAMRGKKVSQVRTVEWRITILYRNLSGHTSQNAGIYDYIEEVRESLTGYTINSLSEAGVMRPIRDGFVSRNANNKLWEYEFIFKHTIPEVEAWQ